MLGTCFVSSDLNCIGLSYAALNGYGWGQSDGCTIEVHAESSSAVPILSLGGEGKHRADDDRPIK